MRKEIVTDLIKKMPGISYNEIVRKTKLSNGVVSHHIMKLIENKEIEKEGINRGKYFLKKIPKKDRIVILVLRQKTNNEIFKLLMKNSINGKIFTQNEISDEIQKSASTISVSLRELQKNNIIERIIMNNSSKITNDLGYKILNENLCAKYIKKYNL